MYENQTPKTFDYGGGAPDVKFIGSATVKALYEVLGIRQTHNIEFQAFFALMQQTGEELGYMSVENEEQDDYVPLPVI